MRVNHKNFEIGWRCERDMAEDESFLLSAIYILRNALRDIAEQDDALAQLILTDVSALLDRRGVISNPTKKVA